MDGRRQEKIPQGQQRDRTLTRRWMDAMGIDAVCLFPTPMLGLPFTPKPEVEVAMARAYNRWLVETVLAEEPGIKASLYLPMSDSEAAYKMVQDFGGKKGVIGFTIIASTLRPVTDNLYARLYASLEERNTPLIFHAGLTWGRQSKNFNLCTRFMAAHALSFSFSNILHMTNWLRNGMPERYPKLKIRMGRERLAWIPLRHAAHLDNEYMMRSNEVPGMKRKPSDYMRDMFYTTQPMEMVDNREALEVTFKMINAETQLLYASDYPHWDMDLPSTIYDLPFISEQARRNILGGNAQLRAQPPSRRCPRRSSSARPRASPRSDAQLRHRRVRPITEGGRSADPRAHRQRGSAAWSGNGRVPQRFAYLGRVLRSRRRQAHDACGERAQPRHTDHPWPRDRRRSRRGGTGRGGREAGRSARDPIPGSGAAPAPSARGATSICATGRARWASRNPAASPITYWLPHLPATCLPARPGSSRRRQRPLPCSGLTTFSALGKVGAAVYRTQPILILGAGGLGLMALASS